jgi:hypothetical protein
VCLVFTVGSVTVSFPLRHRHFGAAVASEEVGIEVCEAGAPVVCCGDGAVGGGAEAAVECAGGCDDAVCAGCVLMEVWTGDVVGLEQVPFECVEVVGDVFACDV